VSLHLSVVRGVRVDGSVKQQLVAHLGTVRLVKPRPDELTRFKEKAVKKLNTETIPAEDRNSLLETAMVLAERLLEERR
jgi:hypothetical protein